MAPAHPSRPAGAPALLLSIVLIAACLAAAALLVATPRPAAAPSSAAPSAAAPSLPPALSVPVHLAGIRMVGPDQVMLLLADEKEERAVPIAVGRDQGIAIYLGKEGAETPRPMTHDLLVQILKTLKASVERITVTELRQNTYYAEIALRSDRSLHHIDARPSDAIALAVRLAAPMFAASDLLRPLAGSGRPGLETEADRRLGLSVQELDADLAESLGAPGVLGVLVASVAAGGEAEKAGLRRGDIIREIDGEPVPDLDAYRAATRKTERSATFSVWRDGKTILLAQP